MLKILFLWKIFFQSGMLVLFFSVCEFQGFVFFFSYSSKKSLDILSQFYVKFLKICQNAMFIHDTCYVCQVTVEMCQF